MRHGEWAVLLAPWTCRRAALTPASVREAGMSQWWPWAACLWVAATEGGGAFRLKDTRAKDLEIERGVWSVKS